MALIKVINKKWQDLVKEKPHDCKVPALSRRELIQRGFAVGLGGYVLPALVAEHIASGKALGDNCPTPLNVPFGYVAYHRDNGPTWTCEFFPYDEAGNPHGGKGLTDQSSKWGIDPLTATPMQLNGRGGYFVSNSHFWMVFRANPLKKFIADFPDALWNAVLASIQISCQSVKMQDDGAGNAQNTQGHFGALALMKGSKIPALITSNYNQALFDMGLPVTTLRSDKTPASAISALSFPRTTNKKMVDLTSNGLARIADILKPLTKETRKADSLYVTQKCSLDANGVSAGPLGQSLFTLAQIPELHSIVGGYTLTDAQLDQLPDIMKWYLAGAYQSAKGFIVGMAASSENNEDWHATGAQQNENSEDLMAQRLAAACLGIYAAQNNGKPGMGAIAIEGNGSAVAGGFQVAGTSKVGNISISTADDGANTCLHATLYINAPQEVKNMGGFSDKDGSSTGGGVTQSRIDIKNVSEILTMATVAGAPIGKLVDTFVRKGLISASSVAGLIALK